MTQDNLKEIVRNKLLNSLSNSNSPYSDLKIKEMLFRLENPDFVKKLNKYKSLITKGDLTLKSIEQNILGDLNNEKSTLLFQEENADNAKAFYEALKGKYSKKQIAALMALSHQETAKGGNKYVKGNVWDPNKIQEGEQGGIVNRGLYSFEEGVNNFKNKKSHEKPTSYWYQDWINTEEGSKYTNPYLSQTEFYINNFLTRTDKKKALKKIFDNPNATIEQITEALHKAQGSKANQVNTVINKAKFLLDKLPNETILSERLNAGRSSVREAMKLLASRNIVTIRQGSGTYIASSPGMVEDPLGFTFIGNKQKLINDLLEVRFLLEPSIAAIAATHADEKDIKKITALCDEVEKLLKTHKDHTQKDIEFHTAIAMSSKNVVVPRLIPVINSSIPLFVETTGGTLHEETIETHREITDAIASHDPLRAQDAMYLHLVYNRKRIQMIGK